MLRKTPLKRGNSQLKKGTLKKVSEKQLVKNKLKAERTKELHEWFLSLWNSLPEFKFCRICGTRIYSFSTGLFDHCLDKGKHEEYEFFEWNLIFPICLNCHKCRHDGWPHKKHEELINKALEYSKTLK